MGTMERLPPEEASFEATASYRATSASAQRRSRPSSAKSRPSSAKAPPSPAAKAPPSPSPAAGALPGEDDTFITAVPVADNPNLLADERELLAAIEESDRNEGLTVWDLTGDEDSGAVVLESIATKLGEIRAEQDRRREELGAYINNLVGAADDDGQSVVDFPDNFSDVVANLEHKDIQKRSRPFASAALDGEKMQDKKIVKGLAKIRNLDQLLDLKVRESKEVARRVYQRQEAKSAAAAKKKKEGKEDADDEEERQEVGHGDRPRAAEVKRSLAESDTDFVRRNMDLGPNARFYTLQPDEEKRVEELLATEPDPLPEDRLLSVEPEVLDELGRIDHRLQKLVVPSEWDDRSINQTLSTLAISDAARSAKSNDYLREMREAKEEAQRLREINAGLASLYPGEAQAPEPKTVSYDEIQRLIREYHEETTAIAEQQPPSPDKGGASGERPASGVSRASGERPASGVSRASSERPASAKKSASERPSSSTSRASSERPASAKKSASGRPSSRASKSSASSNERPSSGKRPESAKKSGRPSSSTSKASSERPASGERPSSAKKSSKKTAESERTEYKGKSAAAKGSSKPPRPSSTLSSKD